MTVANNQAEWSVLLIGGSTGVGKTLAARKLAQHLSISLLLVDDVRIALQQVTTPADHPDLHIFPNYQPAQWAKSEIIRDDWIAVGKALLGPLKAIIQHHVVIPSAGQIIIEGDGVLPALSKLSSFEEKEAFTNAKKNREVRAVFIVEDDKEQLLRNLRMRGRGFQNWEPPEQEDFTQASWLFGQWLTQEARNLNLPVIAAQPHEMLPERILATTR